MYNKKALEEREREDAVRTVARDGDPDRYASALFAPRPAREPLFALYALNVELARAAEQVSEPQLGEIRLQWWREALDRAAAGEDTGNPIADAVGSVARRYALSGDSLAGLIDARSFDVSVKIMPDTAALDDYLGPEMRGSTVRMKFLDRGKVIWVDVDPRTGRIIGKSDD